MQTPKHGTPDTMLYWLATAARYLRNQGGLKQVQIAGELGLDQSTVYRFENAEGWPNYTEQMMRAYASKLEIEDVRDLWTLAIRLWKEQGEAPTIAPADHGASPASELQELLRPNGAGLPDLSPALRPGGKARSPGKPGPRQSRQGPRQSRRSKSA